MLDKLVKTNALATQLLKQHGLDDWTFEFSKTKRIIGYCRYSTKQIFFSLHYLPLTSEDEIEETIKHEIAHALSPSYQDGNGRWINHGREWKAAARLVGCIPKACSDRAISSATYNWVLWCPNCGREWYRYRNRHARDGARCPDCKTSLLMERL